MKYLQIWAVQFGSDEFHLACNLIADHYASTTMVLKIEIGIGIFPDSAETIEKALLKRNA